jgi:hypothetical protein
MAIALYMNQHVPRAITVGLRLRGVDVITAHEDGASVMDDPAILDRGEPEDLRNGVQFLPL